MARRISIWDTSFGSFIWSNL